MTEEASVWGRMFAKFQGEVPAETLEAYRRASLPVFELMDQVEARRQAFAADGLNPWTIPPAARAEFLCAWNAFVLQALGNEILDADYADYPATAGFVPRVTAEQVMACYAQVEGWLDRAHQAHANPDYALDVRVPARMPAWSEVEPWPQSHLRGMLQAMRAVGEHAAAAMGALPETAPDGAAQQKQLNRLRQLYASAQSKARYAAEMHGADASPSVRERVKPYAREAIEMFYELGQLIADPTLVDGAQEPPEKGAGGRKPAGTSERYYLPGQPGFDKWCLTDAAARTRLAKDRKARKALEQMWRMDPDPEATLDIQTEIVAAFARGDVGYAVEGGERIGYWFRCPWSSVYVAHRAITLGGVRLKAEQQFVYEVSAAGVNHGKGFVRRVLPGIYHKTGQVTYDEPGQGG